MHFGEMDLENTPFYKSIDLSEVPDWDYGNAFIFDDGDPYGPWFGIYDDQTVDAYYLSGYYDDPVITDLDNSIFLLDMPPLGWVIKFAPNDQNTSSISESIIAQNEEFNFHAFIDLDILNWTVDNNFYSSNDNTLASIYNLLGKKVYCQNHEVNNNKIPVADLTRGQYCLILESGKRRMSTLFIR